MRKSCWDYPVEVVDDIFGKGGKTIAKMLKTITGAEKPRIMIVADQSVVSQVAGLGTAIGHWVQEYGIEMAAPPVVLTGGERIKDDDFRSALDLVRAVTRAKVGKHDCMVAIGGGTLLDVAGWAAVQVRGGVPIVRVPTTPCSMIDAPFNTYAALDSAGVRDALRLPCVPAGVVIDPGFAKTVVDGVWMAGFGAAMRVAVALDGPFVKKLGKIAEKYRTRDLDTLKAMIEGAIAVGQKKGSTEFAMWGAQRLEAMSCHRLPHGYAVVIGIMIDTNYAVIKGVMSEKDRAVVEAALEASGAMEGVRHNKHLLGRDEHILFGLDALKLLNGTGEIVLVTGLGKSEVEKNPDRDTMKSAVNMIK